MKILFMSQACKKKQTKKQKNMQQQKQKTIKANLKTHGKSM